MIAYVNERMSPEMIERLESMGFSARKLPPCPDLVPPTNSHPDMLALPVGKTVFVYKNMQTSLEGFEKIIEIPEPLGEKYPHDVLLNIAVVGDLVIANTKTASGFVLDHLEKMGKKIRHTNQGYAHCSTCIVSDNAIITADESIARVAREEGIDALLISEGNIELPPYDTGFVGGASGAVNDKVVFLGSIDSHPDAEKIKAFCLSHGKTPVSLSPSPLAPLIDLGGIMFI